MKPGVVGLAQVAVEVAMRPEVFVVKNRTAIGVLGFEAALTKRAVVAFGA